MSIVYYILAVLLIYFSYRSVRGGIDYLNYFKKELAEGPSDFAPFATVICPCKGNEEGLEGNLEALFEQEYLDYEVVLVVDAETDPAVKIIDRLLSRENHPVGEAPTPLLRKEGSFAPHFCINNCNDLKDDPPTAYRLPPSAFRLLPSAYFFSTAINANLSTTFPFSMSSSLIPGTSSGWTWPYQMLPG